MPGVSRAYHSINAIHNVDGKLLTETIIARVQIQM